MDEKIRKWCPNCSQNYTLYQQSSSSKSNLPLFLQCGHSMCEKCIRNIVKFAEPIECKICHRDMIVEPAKVALLAIDKSKLYQIFPVNYHMVGELLVEQLQNDYTETKTEDKEYFVDVHSILKEGPASNALCGECHHLTSKMCQQCSIILCDTCFTKSHKNFIIFKNHVLKDIDEMVLPAQCRVHSGSPIVYYCNDCKKCICLDCLMIGDGKSCKDHKLASMQDVNNSFLEEITELTPKVDETFRRLTKTAYDVGHLMYNVENETGSTSELTQVIANIEQHYSKLCAVIQKSKQEVLDGLVKLKGAEKESLRNAKNDLTDYIKKSKKVMDLIRMTSNPKKLKQMNLAILLEDAKEVADCPWYLTQGEAKKDPLKVAVNCESDLCSLIDDYIHLEGNYNSVYKLCKTSELGEDVEIPAPPPAPVFAPVLPKDVRQSKGQGKQQGARAKEDPSAAPVFYRHAPQYRHKSESVSSLNSLASDSSQKSQYKKPSTASVKPNVQPVPPFSETQQLKPLVTGAQELVFIMHMVDPHNIYVQRACHQHLVREMMASFRNAVSLPKPSINHVTEGKTYLVYNKADKCWQRGRVLHVDKEDPTQPLYQVYCFDFGCTETVHIDKLRLTPPEWQTLQPLAIKCSLANCVPLTGGWSSDDALLVLKIVDNKQVAIYVRAVVPGDARAGATIECDITTFHDGVSLAHALLFHERAKMPNPKLKYTRLRGIREKANIFMNRDDYKNKAIEEVSITHIISPDKFFVRKKHQQRLYEQLSSELEEDCYSVGSNAGKIYLPEIGMSCCVEIPEGQRGADGTLTVLGAWARGVVVELPGRGRVLLSLVDSGATLLAHWSTLRYLHPKHTRLSALTTECHLAGVTPTNNKWSTAAVALMNNFYDRYLELHVEENRHRGSVGVTLFDRSDPEDEICINQEMIKHKFAISYGIYSFQKNDDDPAEQVITNKSPLDKPVRHTRTKPEVQILKRNTPNEPSKVNPIDLQAKDKGPLRIEAKVLQYQSPSLLYISLAHQQKTFNELYENMQKHYSTNKPTEKKDWKVGDRCCAICIQSQTWRRAHIVEIEGDNAKVFFSDFASVETLPISGLAELTPDFASIGDAAIKCRLSGIMPAMGEEWPSITKEYLKELLDSYRRVFITKVGHFKNKSMPIEIWVYHTIHGGALEPNKSEWRCLNKKIVEQGLGIPDRSEEVVETKTEGGDDKLSFLNVTGSINDWLQLEPMPTKPFPNRESVSGSNTPLENEDQNGPEDMESSNVIFISDWLPPEPLQSKEFTAMPTYLDNDGIIYLHDVAQQGTLDLIGRALEVRFKDPDPKAKYQKWIVGEPCVAQFFLDNRFYRGRVIDVNKEASTCTIHYIDYGNEERCSFANMRKSIALHEIPTQAHKCVLSRIRPTADHWDRQFLDYIHKSIVEKQCQVKITGDAVDGITPIDLTVDKLCINDHLVEFEIATYIDGSKAVVRKFATVKSGAKKNVPVSVADSDPDFIIENDKQESFDINSAIAKDWNEMLDDEDDTDSHENTYMTYPNNLEDEFQCNVIIIQDMETLDLDIVHDDDTALIHEELTKDLQMDGETRPPIKGFYKNKACIALFHQDMLWYRASILEYSEAKGKVKVRYVDYGNVDVVDLTDVREIHPDWVNLTPSSVLVKLHGVKVNPDLDVNMVAQAYGDTFLDKGPFTAKVIKKDNSYPIVELRNQARGLVYENLIEKGVFLKCESV